MKQEAESDLGSGIAYLEFDEELPTRQVEKYGDRWFSSMKRHHPEIGPFKGLPVSIFKTLRDYPPAEVDINLL